MGVASAGILRLVRRKRRCERGQMTVELAVALPVLLVVAFFSVNAGLLFSECAAFDRAVCSVARTYADSSSFREDADSIAARIEGVLEANLASPYLEVSVKSEGLVRGHSVYRACMVFHPTLFGLGLRTHFFGISSPSISHEVSFALDAYKPGVVL